MKLDHTRCVGSVGIYYMLIGIDGNEANVEKRVGIGEYSFELLRQFEKYQIANIKYQIYLKDGPLRDLPKEREGWEYRIIGPRRFWTQCALPLDLYLSRPRPDVFFSPTHYAPRFSPVPTVISIMDLSYIHFPKMFKASDLYQLRRWTSYSVKKATKILTISKASRNDIIKKYHISEKKVVVTYPGVKMKIRNPEKSQNSKLKTKYGINKDYILFVGTLQPRKNVVRLIEAFSLLLESSKKDVQLLLVGKKGWLFDEILNAPKRFDVEENVRLLEFVSDDELTLLYQNAVFFILPSLYEGFGLPILEAMQHGCPVITSNVSSLPEAGDDAALYIDPQNVEDIASKMNLLLTDEKLRATLVAKGYEQVKKFSWEKAARETLKVLEEVGKGG